MCFDQTGWTYCDYRKHETPPQFRDSALPDIDKLTVNADSLYYPQYDVEAIERQVVDNGTYVSSPKAHKIFKVLEFEETIGASNGEPSKWVKIEATNGEFHGRPITFALFSRFMDRQIPCCE